MSFPAAHLGVATVLLVLAGLWDLRKRKIPNLLSGAVATTGVVAQADLRGWGAACTGAAAVLVVLALLWLAWSRGRLGGGDVKLVAAAAAWVGLAALPAYLLLSAVAGGIAGVLCFVASSRAARAEMRGNLRRASLVGTVPHAPIHGGGGRVAVPFGAAATAAALVVLWAG